MSVLVLGLASYPSIIPDLDQGITASNIPMQFVIPVFADDEIELEGVVVSVEEGFFTLDVGEEEPITIFTNDDTEFEGFDELTELVGLTVEVDAILVEEELIATEVELETEDEEEEYDEEEIELEVEEDDYDEGYEKVVICHIPPANPSMAHTITIDEPVVDTHLDHGDIIGPCDDQIPSIDIESRLAEREARLADRVAQALQRADDLIQRLEQRIADLEERLQTLLEKLETGEYYGNVPEVDSVINSYSISFNGTAYSLFDESVTTDISGEIYFENLVTTSIVSKFKVTGGEIDVGDDIYSVVFGKARISTTGTSGEKDSMVLILQSIDIEENENTIRLTIHFDSPLEGEFGTEPIGFEILPRSKISGQWSLSATGELSLLLV